MCREIGFSARHEKNKKNTCTFPVSTVCNVEGAETAFS
jgi:hypothetical protein